MLSTKPTRQARFTRKYWLRVTFLAGGAFAVAFLGLLIYFINRQVDVFVTPRRNSSFALPPEINLAYDEVTLTTVDGVTISGWYIAGTKPEAIILVHGIHANRTAVLPEALILREAGYHLLMIDLRGHGKSAEAQLTYGYREAFDVQAAADYLATRPQIEQVGVLGVSLGGAAVARAAALDERIEAVVVENSYSSLPDAVEDAFDNFSIFPKWPFAPLLIALTERRVAIDIRQVDSARDLATISPRSVLIIHGSRDGLFPAYHAEKMYAQAREPKTLWIIDKGGHGNPAIDQEALFKEKVISFFEEAFAR